MANLEIPEHPKLSTEVLRLEPTIHKHSHSDTFNEIHEKLFENEMFLNESKADKSIQKEASLQSASWQGDTAPYSYVLELEDATETNLIEIVPPSNLTMEQYEAMAEASMVGGNQTIGSITLLAYGEKPTIDLPIIILVRGD